MKRESGILLHISSLPSKYGIGTMGKEAYRFVDFLKKAKQSIWQILPIGPTGYGDSPYQSFSVFAGNPYFIDLDMLLESGLLTENEIKEPGLPEKSGPIDYGELFLKRMPILRKAFERGFVADDPDYLTFLERNAVWIYDYSFFSALKTHFDYAPLSEWQVSIRTREQGAMHILGSMLEEEINFHRFVQYLFFRQYGALRDYAAKNGVKIFGDIPIYPSPDSADVWSWPQDYQLDHSRDPKAVAGVPPDYFSDDGQLWGNPLYNWEQHRSEGYRWWLLRFAHLNGLFDLVRIDHFRGLHTYFCIPRGYNSARYGHWERGPGVEFVDLIKRTYPELQLVAEDLGDLDDSVHDFVRDTGLPGMRVYQFAFDNPDSPYLPHNHIRNTVVYTGTHDNDTLAGWLSKSSEEAAQAREYFGLGNRATEILDVIKAGMASVADRFIAPIQDYLELDSKHRMNTPSVAFGNWVFRLTETDLDDALAEKIAALTVLYARTEPELPEKTISEIEKETSFPLLSQPDGLDAAVTESGETALFSGFKTVEKAPEGPYDSEYELILPGKGEEKQEDETTPLNDYVPGGDEEAFDPDNFEILPIEPNLLYQLD